MVGGTFLEPHPNVSLAFHNAIYGNAVKNLGVGWSSSTTCSCVGSSSSRCRTSPATRRASTGDAATMLAARSLGPVGPSDRLTDNMSPDTTTNKSLALATCAADGTLLQPSYPLTPVDKMLTGTRAHAPSTPWPQSALPSPSASHSWLSRPPPRAA